MTFMIPWIASRQVRVNPACKLCGIPRGNGMIRRSLVIAAFVTGIAFSADAPKAKPLDVDTKALAKAIRTMLLANLPDPLIEAPDGWGDQKEVPVGLEWKRKGLIRFRPAAKKETRNDGHWKKLIVSAIDPEKKLTLDVLDASVDGDKILFRLAVGLDANLKFEQQMWAFGKRLYAGETRALCHADVKLDIELTKRLEFKEKSNIPDVILKAGVTKADLGYRDLEVEHTLGVGGDAAKLLGKAFHEIIKVVKPSLEKDILERGNKAIMKAASEREIRLEFDKLLQAKPKTK